ncbi:hypothetical protein K439DRAFT_1372949 [Ramaria rubella]|nr:hypothetical protein K439DRAFT_1372949 [Ramaria rubella]
MLSEASDLTDLSSDDNGGQNTKGKAPTKRTGYRLRNVLKPGRTTQYTAKALYDQIHDNDIDLNPEYQRDVVWSEAKQVGLIDSIFRNFYVPPIIFGELSCFNDGIRVIDGKQRLTSIQSFTNERLWFVDSKNGPKRKLLPPQYRTLFKNKQIVCIEYSELPADLEREVFQRVQMGMALTTAEKLQSISGPWPDLVRHVNNEYYLGKDGISAHIDLDHARARDFQNISQALFCIDQLPAQSQGTTTQLEKWLSKEKPSEATCAKIYDVFRIFRDLAKHKQYKLPLKTPNRIAPAEFIMIGVMIAMFKDQMSLPQLSQAIGILRSENRAVHADIRTNSKVFKTMYHIISSQIKVSALKDTPGVPVAGNTTGATAAMPIGTSMIVSGGVKRKREEYMDVDGLGESVDDEAENQPKIAKVQQMPKDTPVNATNSHPASSNAPVTSSSTTVKIDDNGSV